MTEILGAATTATKLFLEVNQISIDNWTFKLFYKATTSLLLGCSVIASSKQFFGDPINCEVVSSGLVYPLVFTCGVNPEIIYKRFGILLNVAFFRIFSDVIFLSWYIFGLNSKVKR